MKGKKGFNSSWFKTGCAFVAGGFLTFLVMDYIHLKSESKKSHQSIKKMAVAQPQHPIGPKYKDPFQDQFDQMRKRMDRFFNGSFFDSDPFDQLNGFGSLGSHFEDGVKVVQKEDDKYKYIYIEGEGIDKNALNINIENGMIQISGEIKKVDDQKGQNQWSSSSFISRFSRSFNLPQGVDENNMEFENEEERVILKFPKKDGKRV